MVQYNIDEFVWFKPTPRKKYAIHFPHERAFNLNGALLAELGRQIEIAFHSTKPILCLKKAEGKDGLHIPASGSIKLAELTEKLIASNIKPPVQFSVTQQGEYWFAVPEAPRIPESVDIKKPAKQPRKVNATRVLEGIGST